MKFCISNTYIRLFAIALVTAGLFAGCSSDSGGSDDSDGESGPICYLSVYGGSGYSDTYATTTTHVQFDVSFTDESYRTPLDIHVNDVKVESYYSSGKTAAYQYDLGEFLDPGETIHISIAKEGWGSAEYNMIVCASPDSDYLESIAYSPSIETLLGNLDDENFSDTSFTVTVPETTITGCNNISMFIGSHEVSGACESTKNGNSFIFDFSSTNSSWVALRNSAVNDREDMTLYQSFEWSGGEITLGKQCLVRTYYMGLQNWVGLGLPIDVGGVYTLTADYKATGTTSSVTNYGDSSILTIDRDYDQLSVSGKTGTSGEILGYTITLTGHILDADSLLEGQTFNGSYNKSTGEISGSISGYIWDDPSGTYEQCELSDATFKLTPYAE